MHLVRTHRPGGLSIKATFWLLLLVLLTGLSLTACRRTGMPKPVAVPRLSYPPVEYVCFNAPDYPFRFDYPAFFKVTPKPSPHDDVWWLDGRWDAFGLSIHLSYQRFQDTATASGQPTHMAALLDEKRPADTRVRAFTRPLPRSGWTAYVFVVEGNSPIPMEFFVSDGRRDGFSGRLLFDRVPDGEAMTDILNGLMNDMQHLMDSFTPTLTP